MRNKSHPLTIIYFYWITQLSTNRWGKKTSCQDTYAEDTKQFCDISHDSFTLFLHILQWVNTWGQDKKHWGCRARFLEGSCKIQGSPSHVFTAELLFYKISVKKRKVLPIYYSSGKKASHANNQLIHFAFADSNKWETQINEDKITLGRVCSPGSGIYPLLSNFWHFLQVWNGLWYRNICGEQPSEKDKQWDLGLVITQIGEKK